MHFADRFPLVPNSKKPAIKWSTDRFEGVIPDGQAYGLPTGPRNGVWVLDLDEKDGKSGVASLQAYAAGRELPDTYTVRTPSGGWHLYWQWDDARPLGNRTGVLEGVDVRGRGGYVCAGGAYTVARDVPLAPAPAWLYELVGPEPEALPAAPASAIAETDPRFPERVKLAWAYLQSAPPCISGQGGQKRLWEIALRLTRTYELSPAHCWDLLSLPGGYNSRCEPPWEPQEALRAFGRAATLGHGETGMFNPGDVAAWGARPVATRDANKPYRQRTDTNHRYTFDLKVELAGGADKQFTVSAGKLAGIWTGPGAAPEWLGVFQWDTFRRRVYAVNPPLPLDAETRIGLSEGDLCRIQVWCSWRGVKCSTAQIQSALTIAAQATPFHPILDYLDGLPPMTEQAALKYFDGIAERLWGGDEIDSDAFRRQCIAAVRRVKVPGTKVDEMLIFYGAQGSNKSRFLAKLGGEFFSDQIHGDWSNKDAQDALQGVWIVEVAELAWAKTEQQQRKAFLTRQFDRYRPAFERNTIQIDRQCVFFGTTNDDEFLSDPTGARRYNVIEVKSAGGIDLDAFSRDELWAAAAALESAGHSHFSSNITQKSAEVIARRNARIHTDPWDDLVLKFATDKAVLGNKYIIAAECLTLGIGVERARQSPNDLKRVQGIMRRLFGPSKVRWIDNRAVRAYDAPPAPEKVPAAAE